MTIADSLFELIYKPFFGGSLRLLLVLSLLFPTNPRVGPEVQRLQSAALTFQQQALACPAISTISSFPPAHEAKSLVLRSIPAPASSSESAGEEDYDKAAFEAALKISNSFEIDRNTIFSPNELLGVRKTFGGSSDDFLAKHRGTGKLVLVEQQREWQGAKLSGYQWSITVPGVRDGVKRTFHGSVIEDCISRLAALDFEILPPKWAQREDFNVTETSSYDGVIAKFARSLSVGQTVYRLSLAVEEAIQGTQSYPPKQDIFRYAGFRPMGSAFVKVSDHPFIPVPEFGIKRWKWADSSIAERLGFKDESLPPSSKMDYETLPIGESIQWGDPILCRYNQEPGGVVYVSIETLPSKRSNTRQTALYSDFRFIRRVKVVARPNKVFFIHLLQQDGTQLTQEQVLERLRPMRIERVRFYGHVQLEMEDAGEDVSKFTRGAKIGDAIQLVSHWSIFTMGGPIAAELEKNGFVRKETNDPKSAVFVKVAPPEVEDFSWDEEQFANQRQKLIARVQSGRLTSENLLMKDGKPLWDSSLFELATRLLERPEDVAKDYPTEAIKTDDYEIMALRTLPILIGYALSFESHSPEQLGEVEDFVKAVYKHFGYVLAGEKATTYKNIITTAANMTVRKVPQDSRWMAIHNILLRLNESVSERSPRVENAEYDPGAFEAALKTPNRFDLSGDRVKDLPQLLGVPKALGSLSSDYLAIHKKTGKIVLVEEDFKPEWSYDDRDEFLVIVTVREGYKWVREKGVCLKYKYPGSNTFPLKNHLEARGFKLLQPIDIIPTNFDVSTTSRMDDVIAAFAKSLPLGQIVRGPLSRIAQERILGGEAITAWDNHFFNAGIWPFGADSIKVSDHPIIPAPMLGHPLVDAKKTRPLTIAERLGFTLDLRDPPGHPQNEQTEKPAAFSGLDLILCRDVRHPERVFYIQIEKLRAKNSITRSTELFSDHQYIRSVRVSAPPSSVFTIHLLQKDKHQRDPREILAQLQKMGIEPVKRRTLRPDRSETLWDAIETAQIGDSVGLTRSIPLSRADIEPYAEVFARNGYVRKYSRDPNEMEFVKVGIPATGFFERDERFCNQREKLLARAKSGNLSGRDLLTENGEPVWDSSLFELAHHLLKTPQRIAEAYPQESIKAADYDVMALRTLPILLDYVSGFRELSSEQKAEVDSFLVAVYDRFKAYQVEENAPVYESLIVAAHRLVVLAPAGWYTGSGPSNLVALLKVFSGSGEPAANTKALNPWEKVRLYPATISDRTPIKSLESQTSGRLYSRLKTDHQWPKSLKTQFPEGLTTLGDICEFTPAMLLRIRGFGKETRDELETLLFRHGLSLRGYTLVGIKNRMAELKITDIDFSPSAAEKAPDVQQESGSETSGVGIEMEQVQAGVQYILDRPIADMLLSTRLYNCLRNPVEKGYGTLLRDGGFKTIGELLEYPPKKYLRIKNFGKETLDELEHILFSLGLSLKGYTPETKRERMIELGLNAEELMPRHMPSVLAGVESVKDASPSSPAATSPEMEDPIAPAETPAEAKARELRDKLADQLPEGVTSEEASGIVVKQAADQYTEAELEALRGELRKRPFREIAHVEGRKNSPEDKDVAKAVFASDVMTIFDPRRQERRQSVTKRALRDLFFARTRAHFENPPAEGAPSVFNELKEKADSGSALSKWFSDIYDFFHRALPDVLAIRGFRVRNGEGMTWAQRVGIAQALETLEDKEGQPQNERSALFTAEARSGKTIMALLAAFNIRRPKEEGGGYAVNRVLLTTRKTALHEVAKEINMRIKLDQPTTVIVLDGTTEQKRKALAHANTLKGNVILVANYDAVAKLNREIEHGFKLDCHIIDEAENIKGGSTRIIPPQIFSIFTPYRMAISARLVPTRKEDAIPVLAWLRARSLAANPKLAIQYTSEDYNHIRELVEERLRKKDISIADLFELLEPISVRMKRLVIRPELGDPKRTMVPVECNPAQVALIRSLRTNPEKWQGPEKADHTFARMRFELEILVDPELAKERLHRVNGNDDFFNATVGAAYNELPEEERQSPKLRLLSALIEDTLHPTMPGKRPGKMITVANSVDLLKRLVGKFNQRYDGKAISITGETTTSAQIIENLKGNPERPWMLFSTERQIGDSLNLAPYWNMPFVIKIALRLMPSVSVYSALGERLLDAVQGDDFPEEINYVATFPKEPEADRSLALHYLQNVKGNKDFIKGRLRYVGFKSPKINTLISRCLDQSPSQLEDLADILSQDEMDAAIEALRPKTVDEMIQISNAAKIILRKAIIDGIIATDEEAIAESEALSIEKQVERASGFELTRSETNKSSQSAVAAKATTPSFNADHQDQDIDEEKAAGSETSWLDTQKADVVLKSIKAEGNDGVEVLFASKKGMFEKKQMTASARDRDFYKALNESLSINAKLAVYGLIHKELPKDLDDISDQDWNALFRYDAGYLKLVAEATPDGAPMVKLFFKDTALLEGLFRNGLKRQFPNEQELTDEVMTRIQAARDSIREFYASDQNRGLRETFERVAMPAALDKLRLAQERSHKIQPTSTVSSKAEDSISEEPAVNENEAMAVKFLNAAAEARNWPRIEEVLRLAKLGDAVIRKIVRHFRDEETIGAIADLSVVGIRATPIFVENIINSIQQYLASQQTPAAVNHATAASA